MTRHRAVYHAIWIGLVLALASPAGSTAPVKWNQEEAAAIALQLYEGVDSLDDTLYKQGSSDRMDSGGLDYHRLRDRVRVMRSESRHLANELKKGKGHDETIYAFERLMELVRDARELANGLSSRSPRSPGSRRPGSRWTRSPGTTTPTPSRGVRSRRSPSRKSRSRNRGQRAAATPPARIWISTRRFRRRPSGVSLLATARVAP